MEHLTGWRKSDPWGSRTDIPAFLGEEHGDGPLSELWFGGHPDGPTRVRGDGSLAELIDADPRAALGRGLLYSFGPQLPYLMKVIAPAQALSLQVHPTKEIAREGYLREDVLGIPRTDARRTYKDMNHKPEMIYALTDFEALVGFRVPRKARQLLEGLDGRLAASLHRRLQLSTVRGGLRSLVAWLFDEESVATPALIEEFVAECAARLEAGESPSVRTDTLVAELARLYPGDPGIIVAFLMNPVSLRAGEAVYIAPRQIHSYQSGMGIEVMAASDNVVRAGLTRKYVDAAQLVEIAEFSALPPTRLAPEHPTGTTDRFLAPAQEFELSVTVVGEGAVGGGAGGGGPAGVAGSAAGGVEAEVGPAGALGSTAGGSWAEVGPAGALGSTAGGSWAEVDVPGEGPRIVIGLEGEVTLEAAGGPGNGGFGASTAQVRRGDAVFIAAAERGLRARGHGRIIQCAAP